MNWIDDEWGSHATLPGGITAAVTRVGEGFHATAGGMRITWTPEGQSPRVKLFESMAAAKAACVEFLRVALKEAVAGLESA